MKRTQKSYDFTNFSSKIFPVLATFTAIIRSTIPVSGKRNGHGNRDGWNNGVREKFGSLYGNVFGDQFKSKNGCHIHQNQLPLFMKSITIIMIITNILFITITMISICTIWIICIIIMTDLTYGLTRERGEKAIDRRQKNFIYFY